MTTRYFIRGPLPGAFRGKGSWVEIDTSNARHIEYWAWCKVTRHLPVAQSCAYRDTRDATGKRPAFVIEGDLLMHQFAGFAVPWDNAWGGEQKSYSHDQLRSLVEQMRATDVS